MAAEGKKLAIGVFCVDWRLHQSKVRFSEAMRDHLGVDAIDVLSIPGPDGLLKAGREQERDAVAGWLQLLIGAHHPAAIAIVGHYNCAGNPVDDSVHDADVADVLKYYKENLAFRGAMSAFSAVREHDASWTLKEIKRL